MSADHSPTVRRRRLGIELRRLREAADLTIDDVAKHLECSSSKVSRIETGKGVLRLRDVRDMLDLYGLTDGEQREFLLTLAREGQQKGWWTEYDPPSSFDVYIGLEAEAASFRQYSTHMVVGLLQTEDYARALLRAVRVSDSAENVERLLALRMRRQSILERVLQPLDLWVVVDEAALRRPIGGKAVMRAQLEHLIEMSELSNVTIQVLPFERGAHAGLDGSFTIIGFPDPTDTDVVYVESPAGNLYIEKSRDVHRVTVRFDHLRAAALPTDESIRFIQDVVKELT